MNRSTRLGHLAAMLIAGALLAACAPSPDAEPPPSLGAVTDEEAASLPPSITATNAFYYYADVEAAWHFYTDVVGLRTVADYGFAKIMQVASRSYLTLVDAERGMHSADEPKTATLALVTDQVEGWYEYLSAAGVPMRAELEAEPDPSAPHVGFVAIDPEGYYLEFERFQPHPENERLLPALNAVEPLFPAPGLATERPAELGVRATILWLYYRDTAAINAFYERLFGTAPIVDQGWAVAYQLSDSGFLGPVDGARGLHQASDDKGVTVSLVVDDVDAWFAYMQGVADFEWRSEEIGDESGRVRVFVGYDPEGYFLEWDTFLDVDGNEEILAQLLAR